MFPIYPYTELFFSRRLIQTLKWQRPSSPLKAIKILLRFLFRLPDFFHPCKIHFLARLIAFSKSFLLFITPVNSNMRVYQYWRSLIFPLFSIFYVISLIHVHVLNKSSANFNRHYNSFFMGKNFIPEKPERLRLENRKQMSVLCVIDYTV